MDRQFTEETYKSSTLSIEKCFEGGRGPSSFRNSTIFEEQKRFSYFRAVSPIFDTGFSRLFFPSFSPSHRSLRSHSSLATSSRSRPFAHSQSPNRSKNKKSLWRRQSSETSSTTKPKWRLNLLDISNQKSTISQKN